MFFSGYVCYHRIIKFKLIKLLLSIKEEYIIVFSGMFLSHTQAHTRLRVCALGDLVVFG